jgi:hypothetical protein
VLFLVPVVLILLPWHCCVPLGASGAGASVLAPAVLLLAPLVLVLRPWSISFPPGACDARASIHCAALVNQLTIITGASSYPVIVYKIDIFILITDTPLFLFLTISEEE